MNTLESIRIAISAIWANKMRSLLTMLGLIIGISSVVTIISLGEGSKKKIQGDLSSLGINRITIYHNNEETMIPKDNLNLKDLDALNRAFKDEIEYVIPLNSTYARIKNDKAVNVNLKSSTEGTLKSDNLEMVHGRFLNESDIEGSRNVTVIDEDTAKKVFGMKNVVGEKMLIETQNGVKSLSIVGVYKKEQNLFGFSDSSSYVPYTTLDKITNSNGYIGGFDIAINENYEIKKESARIVSYLERRHGNSGENKYSTFSAESQMKMVGDVLSQITMLIGAIGAISLLVGGIGVMNIMLVSVTERTREIGIRKAIGAKYKDIMSQFLIESVMVSGIGGLIGTGFGMLFTTIGGTALKIPATVSLNSVLIATLFSAGIGIFFGIYPASKAAKLDPIVALRYE